MKLVNPLAGALAATALLTSSLVFADHHGNSITKIDSAEFGIDANEIAAIKAQMQAAVDGGFVAGNILLVGNSKGVGVLETTGTQGPEQSTPMDEQTIFRIYSMTKPIVSVATMTLVEDGLLAISDPVSKYIPEFANMTVIDETTGAIMPAANTMTVQDLLTHESGLIYGIFDPQSELGKMYFQAGSLRSDITALTLAKNLAALPFVSNPALNGTTHAQQTC